MDADRSRHFHLSAAIVPAIWALAFLHNRHRAARLLAFLGMVIAFLVLGVDDNGNPQHDDATYHPGWHVNGVGKVIALVIVVTFFLWVLSVMAAQPAAYDDIAEVSEQAATLPMGTIVPEPTVKVPVVVDDPVARADAAIERTLSLFDAPHGSTPDRDPHTVEDHGGYVVNDRRRHADDF